MSGLAEEELERSDASRRWRILAGLLLLAAGIAVTLYLLQGLGRSGPVQQKQVSKITILPDTPPPPPPPPPPPKEQPRENKEIKAPQPNGPPSLWAETVSRSAPSRPKLTGILLRA